MDKDRVSKALVVAYAVAEAGHREVIGLDIGEIESKAFWTQFLRGLRARGLHGLRLVISDHHEGLKNAIARVLDASDPRRCHGADRLSPNDNEQEDTTALAA